MDYIGKDDYQELLTERDGPHVSVYVPIEHRNLKGEDNRLAFRDAVQRAKELLAAEFDDSAVYDALVEQMDGVVDDREFWGSQDQGLAAFFTNDFCRIFRLNRSVNAQTVVGSTFHTRPLLRVMLAPDRFWVVSLDVDQTQLFEGNADGIREVNLLNTPASLQEALIPDEPQRQTRNREYTTTRGVPPAAYQGFGAHLDDEKEHVEKFFKQVDKGLCEMLEYEEGPVILATVDRWQAMYRSLTNLDNLIEEPLTGNIRKADKAQIHQKAWAIAERSIQSRIDETLELWEREYGRGKGETDLANIAQRTVQSQVRKILIEDDRHVWGRLDRTNGKIAVEQDGGRDDPNAGVDDLLDELAEFVIQNGGEAIVVPPELMPSRTGAAAILRGSGHGPEDKTMAARS